MFLCPEIQYLGPDDLMPPCLLQEETLISFVAANIVPHVQTELWSRILAYHDLVLIFVERRYGVRTALWSIDKWAPEHLQHWSLALVKQVCTRAACWLCRPLGQESFKVLHIKYRSLKNYAPQFKMKLRRALTRPLSRIFGPLLSFHVDLWDGPFIVSRILPYSRRVHGIITVRTLMSTLLSFYGSILVTVDGSMLKTGLRSWHTIF